MKKLMGRFECRDFIAQQFFALQPSQLLSVEAIAHQEIIDRLGDRLYDIVRDAPLIICLKHLTQPPSFYLDWERGRVGWRAIAGKYTEQDSLAVGFLYEDSHQGSSLDFVNGGRQYSIGLATICVETNVQHWILAERITQARSL
jgi:hypothetical protein